MTAYTVILIPQAAQAASGNPSYCDSAVDKLENQNFGRDVPVILVHGVQGNTGDWGDIDEPGFYKTIDDIAGVAVAQRLSYNASGLVWVDDQQNGPKLAKTIDCVSQLSKKNGGVGKVIVVGYSMGGLLARDALSRKSTDGKRAIANEVGQVITIATPHKGAIAFPSSLRNGDIDKLPHFPAGIKVYTIAGDVRRVYYDTKDKEVKREHPSDDTLVSTVSATAEMTYDYDSGGGAHVIECDKKYMARILNLGYNDAGAASCEHGQMLKNAQNGVRSDTVEAIKKYVVSLQPKSLTIGSLTLRFDSRWSNVDYGASGPGLDMDATDTTNWAPCTNCSTQPPPKSYAFLQAQTYNWWCTGSADECSVGSWNTVVGAAPSVTIGGRIPDYSARYLDSGYTGTSLVWCFSDKQVCVYYRRAVDRPQLEISQALLDVFRSATWSN